MPIVDRYVFLEWLKIFFLVLGAMFGLQLIVEFQDSFADLLGNEAAVLDILVYYTVLAPSFLTISLPAAVLVSILYALGLLHRNNEIIAFRASGMSVFRVTRSVWLAGIGLSALLWYFNASLIPWSVEKSRVIWDNIEFDYQAQSESSDQVGIVENLGFDNRKDGRLWYMNRFSRYTHLGYGMTISVLDNQRRETKRYTANEGYYDEVDGLWRLQEGRENRYSPEDGELLATIPFDELELKGYDEDPNLMMLFGKLPVELSFLELKRIRDNFTREDNPKVLGYQARFHALMASAASCLIVVGIAIPFAVSGVRANPVVGVSKSLGLFFAYYLFSNIFNAMGRQDYLPPAFAAWAPNVFMIVLAYVLVRRVR